MAVAHNEELIKYVDAVFNRFKTIAASCKGKLSLKEYCDLIKHYPSFNKVRCDTEGLFVRENANDKQMFFASMVVYLAMTHVAINNKKTKDFVDIFNSQYRLKRSIKLRYGNEFEDMFVYIRNLLSYGNKIITKKIITKENIEKWQLVGVE